MAASPFLKAYVPLVDFIADMIGPHCEVVLHDTSDPENSIVAIRNSYISGRSVGGPLTDLGLELMEGGDIRRKDSLVNYAGRTKNGEALISSTYCIRDEDGGLIGMLCVNILSGYTSPTAGSGPAAGALQAPAGSAAGAEIRESLSVSVDQVVAGSIGRILGKYNIPVERMSGEEKNVIIQQLRENGVFKIKGAVSNVAAVLMISESTVYRYLASK